MCNSEVMSKDIKGFLTLRGPKCSEVMSKDIKGKMTGIWTGVFLYAAVGFEHIASRSVFVQMLSMPKRNFKGLRV